MQHESAGYFTKNIINMVSARSVDSEYNINPRKCKKDYSQSRVHLFVAEVTELINGDSEV